MITPAQIPTTSNNQDADERADIEEYIDGHLKRRVFQISQNRTNWGKANIDAVIARYQAAGWNAEATDRGFVFSPQK